jgi:hypothetical protein
MTPERSVENERRFVLGLRTTGAVNADDLDQRLELWEPTTGKVVAENARLDQSFRVAAELP